MREFGVPVTEGFRRYRIEPASYSARKYTVEPDASAASYFFAAAALTGGRITIPGLGEGCSQGDLRFVEILEKMGCAVEMGPESTEVRGPDKLRGVEADMNEISDTFITLAAIAPFASTPTTITGISHTRHQETDRVTAVATELRRLGVEVDEAHDNIRIIPFSRLAPARIRTYGDHRIAMAFSLVGLVSGGVTILDPACVTKTFPEYFERLGEL
jgi:3-phosphoshikimate 1-carboxyvinyltransferase